MDATLRKLIELKRLRSIRIARTNTGLIEFCKLMMPKPGGTGDPDDSAFVVGRHHEVMAGDLQHLVSGQMDTSLLVQTLPPRHGKTQMTSKFFVAWYIGMNPTHEIIVATYNDDFASSFGADVMKIMESPMYLQVFPDVTLAFGGKSKTELVTKQGGKIHFTGRKGTMTGLGAHVLILDDIIKDSQEANSKTIRDQIWDWMIRVAFTRRMGKKLTIMTWTRWHTDDPIGRITDPSSDFYDAEFQRTLRYRNLPALCVDEDDGTGRKVGEALWPGEPHVLDEKFLRNHRRLDPLGFEAMYQGNPVSVDGAMFSAENVVYYDEEDLPGNLKYYAASDHAVSEKTRADSTVLLKGGIDENGVIWLTDCWWQKSSTERVAEQMLLMGGEGNRKPIVWWAESGTALKGFLPFLQTRMRETGKMFYIHPVVPSTDKVTRAQSISARMSLGLVRFPRNKSWVERAIQELTAFPSGKNDDFVDAFAWFGLGLSGMFLPAAPKSDKAASSKGGMTFGEYKKMTEGRPKVLTFGGGLYG